MEENKQTLYNDELLDILPDGVIIFNISGEVIQLNRQALTELHVHSSVNAMMPLPTNILFKLLNNKEDILSVILEKIRQGEQTYSLSEHTFMQEQVDYTQFPIRGDFATIKDAAVAHCTHHSKQGVQSHDQSDSCKRNIQLCQKYRQAYKPRSWNSWRTYRKNKHGEKHRQHHSTVDINTENSCQCHAKYHQIYTGSVHIYRCPQGNRQGIDFL